MIDKIIPRKLNRSKDARLLDKTEMYNAINISIDDFDAETASNSGTGDAGVIKPVKGNDALGQDVALIGAGESFRVVGSVSDEVNAEVYVFVFCTNAGKQGVYKVTSSDSFEAVYTSEHFQFLHDDFVKGDIVYHSDGSIILYFTDGRTEPKKLSLKAGIAPASGDSAAKKIDFITACPKTPMHPPTWEFTADSGKSVNFRSVEGFQFAYQCIYKGGEESAISTYSNVAVPPPYLSQGSLSDPNLEAANLIRVTIPKTVNSIENYTGNIEKIRLLVRIGNNGSFFTVSEKAAADELIFDFYNDSVLTGVPEEDQNKLNDALPRKAKAQSVINDRLIYGNYEEGYDTGAVKASFSTVDVPRPEDFVDIRIGIKSLVTPCFLEDSGDTVSLIGENLVASSSYDDNSKVFNRRASYQFDLSDLPSELPQGGIADISFAVEPDGNFELYNSVQSFHNFQNCGFGLGDERPDSESASVNYKGIEGNNINSLGNHSPMVFQNNAGVGQLDASWTVTNPNNNIGDLVVQNIKFGTSASNPFIVPSEFVKFRAKFRITENISGSSNVKAFIENVLIQFFGNQDAQGEPRADFFIGDTNQESLDLLAQIAAGQSPTVSIDQLMSSSDGYGFISDSDKRARTVVSCFTQNNYSGSENCPPSGFFAINKAQATFQLRYSQKTNNAIKTSSDTDINIGPVFSLHVSNLRQVETVTMIPRVTRSGSRGWIYFTKDFLDDAANQDAVRSICLFDTPEVPEKEAGLDMNVFFLENKMGPITVNPEAQVGDAEYNGGNTFDYPGLPHSFINSGNVEVAPDFGPTDYIGLFRGFQGVQVNEEGGLFVSGNTEIDSDHRIVPGLSGYTNVKGQAFGPHEFIDDRGTVGRNIFKEKIIGYLNFSTNDILRIEDPYVNSGALEGPYSIVDGEVNIRQNYQGGRLSLSYWYGIFYGTEYAGRNNDQFLLSEGSTSDSPTAVLNGAFSYKQFSEGDKADIIGRTVPEVEVGRTSFSFTTPSTTSSAVGRSFKRHCDHSFAILYYDERGRPGEPVPLGSHFVRQISDPGIANIVINIDDTTPPPDWAHTYKILYGGNNSVSDFVQYSSGAAFVPKSSNNENGVIYVSLNHLQHNNEISYSKAFGAVGSDGDKDLYTFSEGDRLRIISFFNNDANAVYPRPNDPYEFQVLGTVTLGDDPTSNPLTVDGDEVHPAKTGQFLIIKDNPEASGFSFSDVAGALSEGQTTQEVYDNTNFWNRRCVFEIFSPQKKKEVESRIYYELGGTYNVVRETTTPAVPKHQTLSILVDQGDVYFRKIAVNMQDFDEVTNSFVGLIGNGTNTIDEPTSPNFRSFHLESKAFTDIFPGADVLPYGKPRVAIQKEQPVRDGDNVESAGSSNKYARGSSMKFSDRSNSNSNIVRYTSFNDAKLPFKDLQTNDGEIFYLVNYSDSIFCIQRLKCSSIPVSRNILSDALGNDTVITTSKVLGSEKYYAGAYGTDVPESVTNAAGAIYFVSVRNKEVYRFSPTAGIDVISEKGMGSFFEEILSSAESAGDAFKVVGGFDPDQQEFIISVTDTLTSFAAPGAATRSNLVAPADVVASDFTFDFEIIDPPPPPDVIAETLVDLQEQVDELTTAANDNAELVAEAFTDGFDAGVLSTGGEGLGSDLAEALETFDATGDGDLTFEDYEQIVAEGFAIAADSYDTDGDGVIGPSDFPEALADFEEAAAEEGAAGVDIQSYYQEGYEQGVNSVDVSQAFQDGVDSVDITGDNDSVYFDGYTAGVAANPDTSTEDILQAYEAGFTAGEENVDITSDNEAVLQSQFEALDTDGDGVITPQDFPEALAGFEQAAVDTYIINNPPGAAFTFADIETFFEDEQLTQEQGLQIYNAFLLQNPGLAADVNGDLSVSVSDLLALLGSFGGTVDAFSVPPSLDPNVIASGFEDFDAGGDEGGGDDDDDGVGGDDDGGLGQGDSN